MRSSGSWKGLAVRRVMLGAVLAVVLLLGMTSAASATSSFYWYGEGNSTCWQTGQLGSSSSSCDSVGGEYLLQSGHMNNDGSVLSIETSGDDCGAYELGEALTKPISENQGPATGFTTGTPYDAFQIGNAYGSVCQAGGATWGQEVRNSAPGNKCYELTCGMNHYVSLKGQIDEPWDTTFGSEPALVLSGTAGIQTFSAKGSSYGGWGYLCPWLEDTETHGFLEYCLQEWRSANNEKPYWEDEKIGECNSPFSMIQTYFYPGTSLATEMGGSANTFVVGSTGSAHFEAKITKADLLNAIDLVNEKFEARDKPGTTEPWPGHPIVGKGCGWGLSKNTEDYRLVGVEQGMEGWAGISEIAGYGSDLQLHTEYTPLPPEATTSAASEVKETQAKLNGTVNPKGTDTHYYFQYGTTTAYGLSTTSTDAGSGMSSVPETATVTGLEPGTVYHYRLVTTSEGGTTYGSDQVFTTLAEQHSNPTWAVRNANTGHLSVYFVGSEHEILEWAWNVGKGWELAYLGGEIESGTLASATNYEANQVRVYYTGANHAIWQLSWNGSGWGDGELGGEAEAGTSPSATRYGSGEMRVYYTSKSHQVCEWAWSGTKWGSRCLGGEVEAGTSPSATTYGSNGMRVYYINKGHEVCEWAWSGTEWGSRCLGGEVEAGTSPSASVYLSNQMRVYYTSKSHKVCEWAWSGTEWSSHCLGGEVAVGASPSASAYLTNQMRVYYTSTNHEICEWGWRGTEWASRCLAGLESEAKTKPAVIFEPYSGEAWVYYRDSSGSPASWSWNGVEWANVQPHTLPSATTNAPSIVEETKSTLTGTVNPRAVDTHYYFQYGTTTSYGSVTVEGNAGSGTSNVPVAATISGLEPGTTYHYRLVSTSEGGTTYGADESFTTLREQHSDPSWAVRNDNTAQQSVYYVGSEHSILEWSWTAGKGWESVHVGGEAETGTIPSATMYESNKIRVYYTGVNHSIWQVGWNGSGWANADLGGEVEVGTSPSATTFRSGEMRVYYTNKRHEVCEWGWLGTEWASRCLGGEVEVGTSPSATTYGSDEMRVYYTSKNHQTCEWAWSGTEWGSRCIGGEVEAGTSPSASAYLSNQMRVYYTSKGHQVCEWAWSGTEWSSHCIGGEVEAGTSPSASAYLSNQMRVYYTAKNHEICQWAWSGLEWGNSCFSSVAEGKIRPAVVFEPYSGDAWLYYREDGSIVSWAWNGSTWTKTTL